MSSQLWSYVFHIWVCQNTSHSLVPSPVSEFPSGFKLKWNLFPSDNFLPFTDIMGVIQQCPVFLRNNTWTPTVRQCSSVKRITSFYKLTKWLLQVTSSFQSASVYRSPAVNTHTSWMYLTSLQILLGLLEKTNLFLVVKLSHCQRKGS